MSLAREFNFVCEVDGRRFTHHDYSYLTYSQAMRQALAMARNQGWTAQEVSVAGQETRLIIICPDCKNRQEVCHHNPQHPIWNAQTGPVRICRMTDDHLENAIEYIQRAISSEQSQIITLQGRILERRVIRERFIKEQKDRTRELVGGVRPSSGSWNEFWGGATRATAVDSPPKNGRPFRLMDGVDTTYYHPDNAPRHVVLHGVALLTLEEVESRLKALGVRVPSEPFHYKDEWVH